MADPTPPTESELWKRRFDRERMGRKAAEALVEARSLELYQAHEKLQASHDELEQRVAERTRELAKAMHRAEEANRGKSEFLASMSHELRTPLNHISLLADLLEEDLRARGDEDLLADLRSIRESGALLLLLIKDILDFHKLDAGRLALATTSFRLPTLLRDLAQTFQLRAGEKGLDFRCELAPDLPSQVLGDPDRLRQILQDLLANAVKFTQRGTVTLLGQVDAAWGSQVRLRFEVSDSGPGIPAEAQERIFLPFEQGEGGLTRRHGGTGLGLAIAKGLVALMQGEIGFRNAEGTGSTFWFTAVLQEGADPG